MAIAKTTNELMKITTSSIFVKSPHCCCVVGEEGREGGGKVREGGEEGREGGGDWEGEGGGEWECT